MIKKLIFQRFRDIDSIVDELISMGAEHPELRESTDDISEESDLQLFGCLSVATDESDEFTLEYVLTRGGQYLITDAYFWDE